MDLVLSLASDNTGPPNQDQYKTALKQIHTTSVENTMADYCLNVDLVDRFPPFGLVSLAQLVYVTTGLQY